MRLQGGSGRSAADHQCERHRWRRPRGATPRAPHLGFGPLISTQPLLANLLLSEVHAIPSRSSMLCYVTKHSGMVGMSWLPVKRWSQLGAARLGQRLSNWKEGFNVQQVPYLQVTAAPSTCPAGCTKRPTTGVVAVDVGISRGAGAFTQSRSVAATLGPRRNVDRGTPTTGTSWRWDSPCGLRPSPGPWRSCRRLCAKRCSKVSEPLRTLLGARGTTRTRYARS